MIDFLASIDPMTLPLWAVVLFAASMYPMGFLFGVCSECCEQCNKCNHRFNLTGCRSVSSISVVLGEHGTLSASGEDMSDNTGEGGADCLGDVDDVPILSITIPGCEGSNGDIEIDVTLGFDIPFLDYDCYSVLQASLKATITNDDNASFANLALLGGEDLRLLCDGATLSLPPASSWQVDEGGFPCGALTDYLDPSTITAEYTRAACDCGACCDAGCEDNIPEGGCTNWAGVGTACNDTPSPCA